MRKYIFISIGGMLGAILRYVIRNTPISYYHGNIPINTLIINVTGSFILALILTMAWEIKEFNVDIRLGIATGFIGSYTTFSTLCKEFTTLFLEKSYFSAILYVILSLILGIIAVYCGIIFARKIIVNFIKKKEESVSKSGVE